MRLPAPLRDERFRPFFAGRLVSLLGDSMSTVALSLAVLGASGRPGDLGIVLAAQMLPHVALLLVGGVVADRWSRRAVLVWSSLGSGLAQGAVAALLVTGRYDLATVAALQLVGGAISAFASPALRGIVPEVVPDGLLQQANSLLASTRNAVRILGPTVAALVVTGFGGGWALALDALSFLLAAAFLARVRLDAPPPRVPSTLVADVRQGWTTLRSLPWALAMICSFGVINLVNVGPWTVLGALITSRLHGDGAWGLIVSVRAVGLLVGSLWLYRLVFRRPLLAGRLAGILLGLPLVTLGLGAPLWALCVAMLVGGLAFSLSGITWETTLQAHVPRAALSRVSSFDDLLSYCAIPVGQLAVGPLAARVGAQPLALACGLGLSLAAAAPVLLPSVRALAVSPPERGAAVD